MRRGWEIMGLFGNEYAMETAIEELRKHAGLSCQVIDRRNLSIKLEKRDDGLEGIVKRAIGIAHGFVESEAPVGEFQKKIDEKRQERLIALDKKRQRLAKEEAMKD